MAGFGGGSQSSIGRQGDIHVTFFVDPNDSKPAIFPSRGALFHGKCVRIFDCLTNFGQKVVIALKHCSQNLIHFGCCNMYVFRFRSVAVLDQTKPGS